MNELSLFSGVGGGLLATKHLLGWRTIGYCENNDYCQRVLAARIRDGYLDEAPIFGDIRTFNHRWAESYRGMVDVVTAGFPCQPFSTAARGGHVADDLSGDMLTTIEVTRPRWLLLENVSGSTDVWGRIYDHVSGALGYVVSGFATVSAASVDAPHQRDRRWLVAHADNEEQLPLPQHDEVGGPPKAGRCNWWQESPASILGMDDGVAHRMDRHKAIGNGQVPAVVERVWRKMT